MYQVIVSWRSINRSSLPGLLHAQNIKNKRVFQRYFFQSFNIYTRKYQRFGNGGQHDMLQPEIRGYTKTPNRDITMTNRWEGKTEH